ncbi:molybdopterin-guanine dinucleotide biosynthesis protein B [Pseudodesulfovibrio sp.]|uniref:molybdopterin-guanine dinucleotide biosynthesis protein B n=1 Tax=unclassified Pseudodesulfovibrio TaxID=2661612 RepID=UPI003B0096F4
MTPHIVCIVGKKKSGKTTFIEKLLRELRSMGVSVGTVKHDAHSFEMDHEGKDSWRHRRAGAETVVVSSPGQVAVIKEVKREMTLSELAETFFGDRQLVIAEGYFRTEHPKVEIFRTQAHDLPLCDKGNEEERNLLAMVTDDPVDTTCPVFGLDDSVEVAALLARRYLGWVRNGMWA